MAQLGESLVEIQRGHRIAAVEIGRHYPQHELQTVGESSSTDFPLGEFHLVQHRFHMFPGHAVTGNLLEHVQHRLFDSLGVLRIGSLETTLKSRLSSGIVQTAELRWRAAEIGGLEKLAQGRGTVVQQHPGQQVRLQHLGNIIASAQQPADHYVALPGDILVVIETIAVRDDDGFGKSLLIGNIGIAMIPREAGQHIRLECLLVLLHGETAEGHEQRVARVIVTGVEILELLVVQLRDGFRIAATVVVIGHCGKDVRLQSLRHLRNWRTHGALHFVVDHAANRQRRIRIRRFLEFQPMTLLGKVHGIE